MRSQRRIWWVVVGMVVTSIVVVAWRSRADEYLHIWFLNTSGDAVLIQTPAGGYIVIDGGEDPAEMMRLVGQRVPFWERRLEAMILTEASMTRLPAQIATLMRYHVDVAYVPAVWDESIWQEAWIEWVVREHIPVVTIESDVDIWLSGGVRLSLVASHDGKRVIPWLEYGMTRVMFAQAATQDDDVVLLPHATPVTLLAYPWERDLFTDLVTAWQPQTIMFTSGYHTAQPATLTWEERTTMLVQPIPLLCRPRPNRTPAGLLDCLYHQRVDGTVEFASNGQHAWVHLEDE